MTSPKLALHWDKHGMCNTPTILPPSVQILGHEIIQGALENNFC